MGFGNTAVWLSLLGDVAVSFLNQGLMLGLAFGALLLLRPVLNRLLRPRYRVVLWFVGWYTAFLLQVYNALGYIRILPVTFRSLMMSRTSERGYKEIPEFLPVDRAADGGYTIALPGGTEFPVSNWEQVLVVLTLIWVVTIVALWIWDHGQNRRLRQLGQMGEKMNREEQAQYGLDQDNIVVRMCKGLPTSFVRWGNDTGWGDGVRFVIYLQKELPPEQMRLILLHEGEHIRQHHAWYKGIITTAMCVYWWNPVVWAAYRLTCRDMELACDEAVMANLEEQDRREYARTLVELASGKHIWGALTCFGECDAVLRVRRVVNWKRESAAVKVLSYGLLTLLVLFFYTGAREVKAQEWEWEQLLGMMNYIHIALEQEAPEDWDAAEVWCRDNTQFVTQGQNGEWYSFNFRSWGNGYKVYNLRPIQRPLLADYRLLFRVRE